jgi:hypothetical protein
MEKERLRYGSQNTDERNKSDVSTEALTKWTINNKLTKRDTVAKWCGANHWMWQPHH